MGGVALSGAVAVIVTIFVLEVSTVLADIVGRRKAEVERDEARERAAKAEAEVKRLRRLIKGNGEGNGSK